jgi:carbon-monoxide dehydrogenase medium subunit
MIRRFDLRRAGTVAEAVGLLGELDSAAVYCGGTELLQIMKLGLAQFDHLIDLKPIVELRSLEGIPGGGLRIGAVVTHRELERSAAVVAAHPELAGLERSVANGRVRNVGSIGGNLCFAEPHSDPAPYLVCAGAELEIAGPAGRRRTTLDAFLIDALTTSLEPEEILVAIELPAAPLNSAFAYRRLAFVERPTVSVACRVSAVGDRLGAARIVVGSVCPVPVIVPAAGAILEGAQARNAGAAVRAAATEAAASVMVEADIGGSEEYKRHLVSVLVRRSLEAAIGTCLSRAA